MSMNFLAQYKASIRYLPLIDEVDYNKCKFFKSDSNGILLPNHKDADPFDWAATCVTRYGNIPVYILIPGQKFDILGTRHGRGDGWYDRFLSRVPSLWLRIGIADISQFSSLPLKRHNWDEPVDWIMIHDASAWKAYKTDRRNR